MDDFALYGKHLLDQNVGLSSFRESVTLRLKEACSRMHLSADCIDVKCFCSLAKESFMVPNNNRIKVYMDKHQMDLLYMIPFLFYLYGQIGLKNAPYAVIYEKSPYFNKLLSFSLLILQAEKCFLAKNLVQARMYLDAADMQDYASDFQNLIHTDRRTPGQNLVLNQKIKKDRQQDIFFSFSLNFFVFHELAHAKYYLSKKELSDFTTAVTFILNGTKRGNDALFEDGLMKIPEIPIEEYVCDTYALYLLFDFIYEHESDYEIEYMIDSYFGSVLSLALINSKESDSILLSEDDYAYAGVRAVNTIGALRIIWANEGRPLSVLYSVESAMKYAFDRFKNLKLSLDTRWNYLYHHYHLSKVEPLSYIEEKSLTTDLIRRFSSIA